MYTDIHTFWIPTAVLEETRQHLLVAGRAGHECFVLWAGQRTAPQELAIRRVIVPIQTPRRTALGLNVEVTGSELNRINRECYRLGQALIAQVHSHPGRAFHSALDDAMPLVATEGCLSIVVPYFARFPLGDLTQTAVYRLLEGKWRQLTADEITRLLRRMK